MIVVSDDQSKRAFCIALLNRQLHSNSMCPANHDVDYRHGWFYQDWDVHEETGFREQRPDLTAEADEIMKAGTHEVGYWPGANTYILMPVQQYEEC